MTDTFTAGTALSTLLTTESLLFAALSLSVSMMTSRGEIRRPLIPNGVLAGLAMLALVGAAVGAGSAWFEILATEGLPRPASLKIGFFGVIVAIVVQPVVGLFVALSLRD